MFFSFMEVVGPIFVHNVKERSQVDALPVMGICSPMDTKKQTD
jgi:hypothetical protein